jgi:branched-chain amino acid transport system ATP-binding protein
VRIALQRKIGTQYHFWKSSASLKHLDPQVMELLEVVGLSGFSKELAVQLPYGRKRVLELATTLAMDPEMMLLDEPTQGMGHEDVERITNLIAKVSQGRTVLMVEHNMKVVASIANQISVLQRGAVLAEGTYDEVSNNPLVLEAYMGTVEVS